MKQSAAVRPEPTLQRKAAIAAGGVKDHAGSVQVEPIENFDYRNQDVQLQHGLTTDPMVKLANGYRTQHLTVYEPN